MKNLLLLTTLIFTQFAQAQNTATEVPITMNQLMDSLRIRGGNWEFNFATPVIACVKSEISNNTHSTNKEIETLTFISDEAKKEISLFYMDSPWRIGEIPSFDSQNERVIQIKLSDCKQTSGTRLLRYFRKFSTAPWNKRDGQLAFFSPAVAKSPELNKEYILTYYFKKGDPYEAKVTICFVEQLEDLDKVIPFDRDGSRSFKITSQ